MDLQKKKQHKKKKKKRKKYNEASLEFIEYKSNGYGGPELDDAQCPLVLLLHNHYHFLSINLYISHSDSAILHIHILISYFNLTFTLLDIPLETLIVPISSTSFTDTFSYLPCVFGTVCSTRSIATKMAMVSMSLMMLPIRKFLTSQSVFPFISRSALYPCDAARFHCTLRFLASAVAMVILSSMMKMPISTSLTYLSSFSFIPHIPYTSTLPSMALMAMAARSFIPMMAPFIRSLTYPLSCSLIKQVPSLSRVRRTPRVMAMVVVSLIMMMMPMSTSLTCPINCSTTPLPYPFGALPGCGSPGFQLTNCSIPTPLWNLTVAGTPHPYYIKSINSNPNYGYSGTVQLDLNPSTADPPFCGLNSSSTDLNSFTTSNFYAFPDANLSYYQDSYLFFNCTESSSRPDTGVLTPSSPSCRKYLSHCNLSMTMSCLEYVPFKELQLASLMNTYKCSSLKRFLIANESDPVSTWVSATQFAWDSVTHADSCSSCQSSGGTCGYDTQDDAVFQCYCGNETHNTNCHEGSGGNGKSIGVGVSVAVIFLLVLLGIAYYYRHQCYYYGMFRKEHLNLDGVNQAPLELPYGALAAATKSFSTKIGQGAFGKVYRGVLSGGIEVAVKVLDASVSHTDGQFMNEVATIGNIHHVNVARLVGFCFQKSRRILVYEYVSNGSLDKYLFPSKQSSSEVLTWKQRYDIALGIARGLCYMHEDCRSCIIHCDIKPQNILLDAAFCPKIADFGLARLLRREESRVLTQARGTPGYVAPEFWSLGSGPLSAKFDVYSYGIMLLEIIGGKRGFDDYERLFQDETEDGTNAWISVSVDKRIEHDVDVEQVKLCTLVAFWCIQENPNLRPTMSKVVQFLQGTAPVPSNPPKPFKNVFQGEDSSQVQVNSSDFLLSSTQKVFSITLSRD